MRVVFGLIFLPLLPELIYFNSYILSYSLEILFDRTGDLLFTLTLGDWSREITDWDMYAALISLSQSIGGAGFYNALGKEDRNWPLLLLTGIGTLALLVFEVGLAINRKRPALPPVILLVKPSSSAFLRRMINGFISTLGTTYRGLAGQWPVAGRILSAARA